MAIPKSDKDGLFTYHDYRSWPEEERWELIHGVAYNMSPAPNRRHQGMVTYLTNCLYSFFENQPCRVYVSPFDVLLPDPDENQTEETADTVVQPDLVVVCDPEKLTEQGCTGAPDFVLEILSPATAFKDMEDKLRLYERHGVREYWIINPGNDTLMVYSVVGLSTEQPVATVTAGNGETPAGEAPARNERAARNHPVARNEAASSRSGFTKPVLFTREDTVAPRIFPDLKIDLDKMFSQE